MSFHKDTKGLIEEAVQKEYENAIAVDKKQHKGRYYNTLHEGYGVLLEEMLEAKDSFWRVTRDRKHLFGGIICNNTGAIFEDLTEIIKNSMDTIMEMTQVVAVCKKMIDTIYDCYKGGNE